MNWELIEHFALRGAAGALALLTIAALLPIGVYRAVQRPMRAVVDVNASEMRPLFMSALYFFFTLAAYSILRPIRDEMAVASGSRDLPWLFLGTLGAMLVVNPLYATLVSKFPVKRFVAFTYSFFAVLLLVFYLLWQNKTDVVMTGRVFFVFTTVFGVFVTSVFWGVMADRFSPTQAKRLFGFIGIGGTLGAITGSALTAYLSERLGVSNLLLISAAFVVIAIAIVAALPSAVAAGDVAAAQASPSDKEVIGGSALAGMTHVFKSPYLLAIAGFLFLYVFGSTVLYAAQSDIVGQFYTDRAARTALLARITLTVNLFTVVGQTFFTARAIRVAGLRYTLGAVPIVSTIGFIALGLASMGFLPLLQTLIVFSIARGAAEYTFTNPSRKVLFTVISREDKYKATNFIETFVYRFGDQIAVWSFAGLGLLGFTLTGISFMTVPLALVYLGTALWLARRQGELAAAKEREERVAGT